MPNATLPFQMLLRPETFPPADAHPAPTAERCEAAAAELAAVRLPEPSDPEQALVRAELAFARDAAVTGCRMGALRAARPGVPLEGLAPDARGSLAARLAGLVTEHRRLWPARSRRGGLDASAAWLEGLLETLEISEGAANPAPGAP